MAHTGNKSATPKGGNSTTSKPPKTTKEVKKKG